MDEIGDTDLDDAVEIDVLEAPGVTNAFAEAKRRAKMAMKVGLIIFGYFLL